MLDVEEAAVSDVDAEEFARLRGMMRTLAKKKCSEKLLHEATWAL